MNKVKEKPERLDKILSSCGALTRSEARRAISQGRLTVDGVPARSCETKITRTAQVCLDGKMLDISEFVYIMLNKPQGYVCSTDDGDGPTVFELIKNIQQTEFNVMPHFTCICSSKDFVKTHIHTLEENHIENILALRGDIPEDKRLCCYDFRYANELVEFIKTNSNLSTGVAGYPEGHIESASLHCDIENLKKKIDAGADAIFTQLFFDNNKFFKYIELIRKKGVTVPVIAGIMPILSKKQIDKMTTLANISIPQNLREKITRHSSSSEDMKKLGIEYAANQCRELIENNVDGLHFFTLNKSESSSAILNNIL